MSERGRAPGEARAAADGVKAGASWVSADERQARRAPLPMESRLGRRA
jgi:hypothetical protein